MEFIHGALVVLIGIGAGFVQRVSGFGLGIFAMLFLPHFMTTHTAAAAIVTMCSATTTTYNAVRYRKNIAYKTALPMICAALLSIPVAVRFSTVVSADGFKFLLGAVLIVLSIFFLFFNSRIHIRPGVANGVLAGLLGGTLGGLFSTGGPPAVLYLTNAAKDKAVYFATIQFYFCFTNIYSTIMRIANGIIDRYVLLYAAAGIIGCLTGDFLGRRVFDKLDSVKLKKTIYIGMIVSGVLMFV